MKHPKIKFYVNTIENDFNILWYFLDSKKNSWDWSKQIYKKYPKLKTKIKEARAKQQKKNLAFEFFKKLQKKEEKTLFQKQKIFQKEWNKIETKIFEALSEVTETKWFKKPDKIFALVSLSPICPRDIQNKTFNVFYKDSLKVVKETIIHELLHFIYFKKWKEVFPKTKEKEFDRPFLVWHLSEIVPEIILNDEKIQKIFKCNFQSYEVYQKLKINNRPLLKYIQEFYDNRKNFETFLKQSWSFIKKHEKEIKSP